MVDAEDGFDRDVVMSDELCYFVVMDRRSHTALFLILFGRAADHES